MLYLTDMKDGRIYQFNPASEAVIGSIPVAEGLCGLDFARDRKKAFTGNMIAGGQVVVLDWETKKVIEKIPVGTMPHHSGKIVDQISGIGPRACDVIYTQ